MPQYKKYYIPKPKEELFRSMEHSAHSFDIISGGIDLFAEERAPLNGQDSATDTSSIKDFSIVESRCGFITIGTDAKIQQFLEELKLADTVPVLRRAASYFANQQIREIITVGGNLVNTSSYIDLMPSLLAVDIAVHTTRQNDNDICMNNVPLSDFTKGVGKTSLSEGEVIQSITCPTLEDYGYAFKRIGLRHPLCISVVNSAFLAKANETNQYFKDVRIMFEEIGPAPIRLNEIEDNLEGNRIPKGMILKVAGCTPGDIVKSRSRREHRKTVIGNFLLTGCSLMYKVQEETN